MACILGSIVFVDELDDRIEPALQLSCMVAGDPGCPNLPAGNYIVEIRAEPRLIIILAFSGTAVDMDREALEVLPNLLAEHDYLRTAFERVRKPVVEVSRAAVPGGAEVFR